MIDAPPGSVVRVAVLAESRLQRDGLRSILASDASIAAVVDVERDQIRGLAPGTDILLVDAHLDDVLSLCRELPRNGARPRVVLFNAEADVDWAVRALEAGARGILPKDATTADLTKAIGVIHAGQIWARKHVIARIVEELATASRAAYAAKELLMQRLSPRQQEIVNHAVSGLSNQEIAGRLGISEATVKAHLTHIFEKLSVRDRAQLLARYHAQSSARAG